MSNTKTYSNVTITSSSATVTPIYTTGTGIGYNPVEATWSAGTSKGTMHAQDLVLDGVSLKQLLEDRLNLLVPNPELEKEWTELKELGDAYRKLEEDLKEKSRIWRALNKKS